MGLETQPRPVVRFPLAQADIGIAQTIMTMQELIDSGSVDPEVRSGALEIVRQAGIASRNDLGEVTALLEWVRHSFRFTKDPVGKETIGTPSYLLHVRAGDCDDYVVVLGALLKALGHPVRIVTIAADPLEPSRMSHVFLETLVCGRWLGADATQANVQLGWEPPHFYRRQVWRSMIPRGSALGYIKNGPQARRVSTAEVIRQRGMQGLGQILTSPGMTIGSGSPETGPISVPGPGASWPASGSGGWAAVAQQAALDFAQAGASRVAHGVVPVVSIPYVSGGTPLLTGAALGGGSVLLLVAAGLVLILILKK